MLIQFVFEQLHAHLNRRQHVFDIMPDIRNATADFGQFRFFQEASLELLALGQVSLKFPEREQADRNGQDQADAHSDDRESLHGVCGVMEAIKIGHVFTVKIQDALSDLRRKLHAFP